MPSDASVVLTDDFNESDSATQFTVKQNVLMPVAAARQLLMRKSACQKLPHSAVHVLGLGVLLFSLIILCVVYETWFNAVSGEQPARLST